MDIGIIIFLIVGALGVYSILRRTRQDAQIKVIVQDFLAEKQATLLLIQKAPTSGPFEDSNYDKGSAAFGALGHKDRRIVYKLVRYEQEERQEQIYLRVLVEKQKVVKHEWR